MHSDSNTHGISSAFKYITYKDIIFIERTETDMGEVLLFMFKTIFQWKLRRILCMIKLRCYGFNLPHIKPILVGCCYRPPSSDQHYLEAMGEMLDKVCELNMEIVFTGDINIDWLSPNCSLKNQLVTITDACCLKQVVTNNKGINTASCIDHIYLSADDLYTKAVSVPIGCSDHNIVVVARKMKVPKARPRVIYKRSYRGFSEEAFLGKVSNIQYVGLRSTMQKNQMKH